PQLGDLVLGCGDDLDLVATAHVGDVFSAGLQAGGVGDCILGGPNQPASLRVGELGPTAGIGHNPDRPWPQSDIGGDGADDFVVHVAGDGAGLQLKAVETAYVLAIERSLDWYGTQRLQALLGDRRRAVADPRAGVGRWTAQLPAYA